ncbi:MAG: hypothetical protein J0M29_07435 [Chitinophagales bacterium]|nr:hypothetical protein [Chitinophagales bacterium]
MQANTVTFQVFMNHHSTGYRLFVAVIFIGCFVTVLFGLLIRFGTIPALLWMVLGGAMFSWLWRRSGYQPALLMANDQGMQWVFQKNRQEQRSEIMPWTQLLGYQYAFQGRGPNVLLVKWMDGQITKFYKGDAHLAFEYLVQHFPEKERDFWARPGHKV